MPPPLHTTHCPSHKAATEALSCSFLGALSINGASIEHILHPPKMLSVRCKCKKPSARELTHRVRLPTSVLCPLRGAQAPGTRLTCGYLRPGDPQSASPWPVLSFWVSRLPSRRCCRIHTERGNKALSQGARAEGSQARPVPSTACGYLCSGCGSAARPQERRGPLSAGPRQLVHSSRSPQAVQMGQLIRRRLGEALLLSRPSPTPSPRAPASFQVSPSHWPARNQDSTFCFHAPLLQPPGLLF